MDIERLQLLADICPCLSRRTDQKIKIPNFIKLEGNSFSILDSAFKSKKYGEREQFIEDEETKINTDDELISNISDDENLKCSSFDSPIENNCYQFGNINLESSYKNDIFSRKESKYRAMMSLDNSDEKQSQIKVNQLLPFIPGFIINNMMKIPNDLNIDSENNSKFSINTLEYEAVIIFCDASGFTSLADSLCRSKCGAVRLGNCLNKFLDPLIETIYSWGGEILSFSGDAVTACWLIHPSNNKSNDEKIKSGLLALACCGELHLGLNKFPTPITDKVLSLHIGIEYGNLKLTPLQVYQDSSISFIITGDCIIESAKGATIASSGETVIGSKLFETIKDSIRATPLESGHHKLKHVICSVPAYPERNDDTKIKEDDIVLLNQLIHPNIFNLLHSGLGPFSNELRRISAVFVGYKEKSLSDSKIEDSAIKFHIDCKKLSNFYGGILNKTNIDDKGIISLILFGLPPDYRNDYATRAVLTAKKIANSCGASAGVVTGYAWCGLLGNDLRKEYTALGDLINISARLMDLADEGQVLVDQATYKRVKRIPFVLSSHKKIKGKDYELDIYQIINEASLDSQASSNQNLSRFLGRLINWELWPFKKNINNLLDPLVLNGGVKNIVVSKRDGLSEIEILLNNYFSSKNWTCMQVKNGNWRELLDKILSKNKISRAKQLLLPKFHSRIGALFDSPFFGEDRTIIKKFSFGLDLEGARKVWGSIYEILIELIKGYARSFGSTGVLITTENSINDSVLEEIVKFVMFDGNPDMKIVILILGNNPLENIPHYTIQPLSKEETKHLTAFILRQNSESPNMITLSEYIYKITGGSIKYISQTIKLLLIKGLIKWERIGPFKTNEYNNGVIKDNVSVVNRKLRGEYYDFDSDTDVSISIVSENECSLEDLDDAYFDSSKDIEEYGDIIIRESLDNAPIIESMWIEAIEMIDNLPGELMEAAISIVTSNKQISPKTMDLKILNSLFIRGIIIVLKNNENLEGTITTYMIANDAIRRILTEKHISRTCS